MQGYDFIDQSSMRAAPGEAERLGGGRCEARWGPWVGGGEEDCLRFASSIRGAGSLGHTGHL